MKITSFVTSLCISILAASAFMSMPLPALAVGSNWADNCGDGTHAVLEENGSGDYTCVGDDGTLYEIYGVVMGIINNILIPGLFAVAFLVFLFGVFKYFIKGGADSKAHEEGRTLILYGLIGFAVMVSVWGLVNIVTGSFGLDGGRPAYPML